jgi:hypothetical protein
MLHYLPVQENTMDRYSITLVRDERNVRGFLATDSIGATDYNAISSIPGTKDVRIENEAESQVEISYSWTGAEQFDTTQEHLSRFGLARKECVKTGA